MKKLLLIATALGFVTVPALAADPLTLTPDQAKTVITVLDAGIKAVGVQLFQDPKVSSDLQSALIVLSNMEQVKPTPPTPVVPATTEPSK